jgi:hypothetical protein
VPLASVLMAMYKRWWEEDPEVAMRKKLGGISDNMKDALLYGVAAYGFGEYIPKISLGGSVEFTVPDAVASLIAGSMGVQKEDFTTEMAGAGVSVVKDVYGGFNAWAQGDKKRAMEYVAPLMILRNILVANRLHNTGQYTLSGQPIVLPPREGEEIGPTKISKWEAIWRSMGFQSLKMEKSYRLQASMEGMDNFRKEAQNKLASRYANAFKDGNTEEQIRVIDEVQAWNIMWGAKNRPEYMINPTKAIESRIKPDFGPKVLQPEAMRTREAMGF